MYRQGHIGVSLLLYLPLGYYLIHTGEYLFAIAGIITMLSLTMLPDIDHRIPLIPHRGVTHSIWFAGGVGYVTYRASLALVSSIPQAGSPSIARFLGAIAGFAILSHLVADAFTPMGVQPLTPFLVKRWSFNIMLSSDTTANRMLLAVGLLSSVLVLISHAPPGH